MDISNNLSPFVYWGQTRKIITLKVDLRNIENEDVELTEDGLTFTANGLGIKGHHRYKFDLPFYLPVVPQESQYRKTDLAVEFQIQKTVSETWPRLTVEKIKLPWLKIDFDRFEVEDSEPSDIDSKGGGDYIDKIVTEMGDPKQSKAFPSVKSCYLVLYNLFQFIGYTYILGALLIDFIKYGDASKRGAFETAGSQMMVCQTVAMLEVINAFLGLVKSNTLNTFMQIAGRNFLLFVLILQEPRLQLLSYCWYLFVVWSAIETVRYPFYLLQLFGMKVRVLTWLRYSLWIPLYPIGVLIESFIVFNSIEYFSDTGFYSFQLPNNANFAFYFPYFLMAYLVILSFGATTNLNYMRIQRQKQLSMGTMKDDIRKKA